MKNDFKESEIIHLHKNIAMDFSSIPIYLRLLTKDEKILYYPRDKLIKSCNMFSILAEDCGKEELTEVRLSLTSSSLELFLRFLKKKDLVYSVEEDIEILRVADMVDVKYLNSKLSNKKDILNHFYEKIRTYYYIGSISYTIVLQFLRINGFLVLDWGSCHYLLTHLDSYYTFKEKRRMDTPVTWPQNGEKVEYEGRIYYVHNGRSNVWGGEHQLYEKKEHIDEKKIYCLVSKGSIAPPL